MYLTILPPTSYSCACNFPVTRYGFDYGSAHFVLMSTEHDFNISSPQYQFLDSHLKTVDRMKTPWLIFGGHRYIHLINPF